MTQPTLFNLLPAVIRRRDSQLARQLGHADGRGPLAALLALIDEQVAVLDADIDHLYDDHFIETCAEWAVAYLGELVGAPATALSLPPSLSRRALVANHIGMQQRKGTVPMVEQVARDATGWPARAVEFMTQVSMTQTLNRLRPANQSVDLRQMQALREINTPFNEVARTAEVGRIASGRGRFNLPNIGVFLYRLRVDSVTDVAATPGDAPGRFFFSRLGVDQPLFNQPLSETSLDQVAARVNLPLPLTRYDVATQPARYLGAGKAITLSHNGTLVAPAQCCVTSLAGPTWGTPVPDRITLDPETGRLFVPPDLFSAGAVRVSYYRGRVGPYGGGEYERTTSLSLPIDGSGVILTESGGLRDHLDANPHRGHVTLASNAAQRLPASIWVPAGRRLTLQADNQQYPLLKLPEAGWQLGGAFDSELVLSGLLLRGGDIVIPATFERDGETVPNQLQHLALRHCTLAAASRVRSEIPLTLTLNHCDVNQIEMPLDGLLQATHSAIVSQTVAVGGAGGFGPAVVLENCTVIGQVRADTLTARNTIFDAAGAVATPHIQVRQRQQGCLAYCCLPAGATTPRRVQCVVADAAGERAHFNALAREAPAYLQLADTTPAAIRHGADDGSAMGITHDLFQPQREALLQEQLADAVRFGLEVGVFFVT